MASFGDQIESSRVSHLAVRTLEETVRIKIAQAFLDWENGRISNRSIRFRLEAIVRDAYRGAAAVGVAQTSAQSGIPGWRPVGVFSTDYLDGLLADTRRNLREYRASKRDVVARTRAVSRIQHSAGVGATRGYTDAILETNRELKDFGYLLRKLWVANFVENTPCEFCQELHGTEVGLAESFPSDQNVLKIYGDLKGPPRHPRCKCRIVILQIRLENLFERIDVDNPQQADLDTITTDEIQALPTALFDSIVRGLRKLLKWVRRKS